VKFFSAAILFFPPISGLQLVSEIFDPVVGNSGLQNVLGKVSSEAASRQRVSSHRWVSPELKGCFLTLLYQQNQSI